MAASGSWSNCTAVVSENRLAVPASLRSIPGPSAGLSAQCMHRMDILQAAQRVGTRLTFLNVPLDPATTASCQIYLRDHLQDEPDLPSGAFGIRSTTPVCTRCCLPLSLSHSCDHGYRQ
jgi:hypothetical protein